MLRLASQISRTAIKAQTRQISSTPVACLNIHEYSGVELFKKYGVNVPAGGMAETPEEAEKIYEDCGSNDMVMKAQVLAGGRGKGHFANGFQGGVHFITEPGQAAEMAGKMLNQTLITKQTGAEGKPCSKVFLAERVYSRRELYFAVLMDRATQGPVLVASTAGGTSIEDVAAATPEKILTCPCDINTGPTQSQLEELASGLGFKTPELAEQAIHTMKKTYDLFRENDVRFYHLFEMFIFCTTFRT